MRLSKCPYCGKKISYKDAFLVKSKGEYKCVRCERESNIFIDKKIIPCFILAFVVALIIMLLIILYIPNKSFYSFLLTLIPFCIFYIFVPAFVKLRPIKKYKNFIDEGRKAPVNEGIISEMIDDSDGGPVINTDVFMQIKENRKKLIKQEEAAEETKVVSSSSDYKKNENTGDKTTIFDKTKR